MSSFIYLKLDILKKYYYLESQTTHIMTIMAQARQRIKQLTEGELFTYDDINVSGKQVFALSQALSRLVEKGEIERWRNGIFYKPKDTQFGKLQPSEKQIIELILSKKVKSKGYVTGLSVYNKLGLTTQISNQIIIATPLAKKSEKIGYLEIKFVKGIAPKSKKDIGRLQLLDAIKDFRRIPDREDKIFFKIISKMIKTLFEEDSLDDLLKLAKNYSSGTKALLGAILELNGFVDFSVKLKSSLNGLTKYKLGISEDILPNKKAWNIL